MPRSPGTNAPHHVNIREPPCPILSRSLDGRLRVPDAPVIPFIEGDGTGPDIWRAAHVVFDGAVRAAYGDRRRIQWLEVFAGEKAKNQFDNWLPDDTLTAIRRLSGGDQRAH